LIPEEDPDEDTEYDKRLPRSDFGDYCPVTFVKDGYMVKGDAEFEESVYHKTFRFAGEAEQKEFNFNPSKFLKVNTGEPLPLPLTPPMPKIMITGVKGAGTSSQVRMICEKYKLEDMVLKDCFLKKLKDEKAKRRRERHLKRGFKPLPEKEEDEDAEEPRDAELDEEEEDFEREAHEKECMKALFDAKKGLVIDGNWSGIPEETVDQPAPTVPLESLLLEARRMPEMIIVLRTKLEKTLERCMDK
jgi:adenylate kinase family enzyme/YHS domain-containing protein